MINKIAAESAVFAFPAIMTLPRASTGKHDDQVDALGLIGQLLDRVPKSSHYIRGRTRPLPRGVAGARLAAGSVSVCVDRASGRGHSRSHLGAARRHWRGGHLRVVSALGNPRLPILRPRWWRAAT
jgi:hypothetical protein